jgi:hypothetical protein
MRSEDYILLPIIAATAEELVHTLPRTGDVDIWKDELCMAFLRNGGAFRVEDLVKESTAERRRAMRRAKVYEFNEETLWRRSNKGTKKKVPRPEERDNIIKDLHEGSRHFGKHRTIHLLLQRHWWPGLYKDVEQIVRSCPFCNRVNASFGRHQPTLHPFPTTPLGPGYRVHIDMAGPFPTSTEGNRYAVLAVDAFTKMAIIGTTKDKTPKETARFFKERVMTIFGANAVGVTDGEGEWETEFHDLMGNRVS